MSDMSDVQTYSYRLHQYTMQGRRAAGKRRSHAGVVLRDHLGHSQVPTVEDMRALGFGYVDDEDWPYPEPFRLRNRPAPDTLVMVDVDPELEVDDGTPKPRGRPPGSAILRAGLAEVEVAALVDMWRDGESVVDLAVTAGISASLMHMVLREAV